METLAESETERLRQLFENKNAFYARAYYTIADQLIAWIETATVRNKTRRTKFEDIGMPPEPALTRWATWLEACCVCLAQHDVVFYVTHSPFSRGEDGAQLLIGTLLEQ